MSSAWGFSGRLAAREPCLQGQTCTQGEKSLRSAAMRAPGVPPVLTRVVVGAPEVPAPMLPHPDPRPALAPCPACLSCPCLGSQGVGPICMAAPHLQAPSFGEAPVSVSLGLGPPGAPFWVPWAIAPQMLFPRSEGERFSILLLRRPWPGNLPPELGVGALRRHLRASFSHSAASRN